MATLLDQIDGALTPTLGPRGVALLYKRAVFLSAQEHPWMIPAQQGIRQAMDSDPLRSAMVLQAADAALAGGCELLNNFYELLANLVGLPLTERLLRSVWANHSSSAIEQDISP